MSQVLPKSNELKIWTTAWMIFIHLAVCLAPFCFTWPAFFACIFLYWLTCSVGITMTYHRLLTHRSFKLIKPLEYLFTLFGAIALQGGPVSWVGIHRMHHGRSDKEGDPHSPMEGFFWAHSMWMLTYGNRIDCYDIFSKYAKDLTRDPVHRFLDAAHGYLAFGLAVLLFIFGGMPFLIWGFFVRLVLAYHATWLINSASHMWGYRNFHSADQSRNNWLAAILAFGEGWHNNHHTFQGSAKHGMRWWEFDATYVLIKALSWVGAVKDIRIPDWRKSLIAPSASLAL